MIGVRRWTLLVSFLKMEKDVVFCQRRKKLAPLFILYVEFALRDGIYQIRRNGKAFLKLWMNRPMPWKQLVFRDGPMLRMLMDFPHCLRVFTVKRLFTI